MSDVDVLQVVLQNKKRVALFSQTHDGYGSQLQGWISAVIWANNMPIGLSRVGHMCQFEHLANVTDQARATATIPWQQWAIWSFPPCDYLSKFKIVNHAEMKGWLDFILKTKEFDVQPLLSRLAHDYRIHNHCEDIRTGVAAFHIRRPNPRDTRAEGTNAPLSMYMSMIERYRSQGYVLELHTQPSQDDVEQLFDRVVIDGDPLEAFFHLITAEVLVMAPSSFSYAAALLRRPEQETVYYPFWHQPLPHWRVI